MRRLLIIAALVAGTLVPAAGALAAAPLDEPSGGGGIGVRILDAPVDRQDDPRARLYVIDHIDLGDSIERRIEVSNTTDETQQVAVYAAAATIADGSFIGSEGHTPNDLTTWTSLDQGSVEIAPDGVATITMAVDVPGDAPPGEQYAVVWAEARSAPAAGGVTMVNRVGIRMYIDVGPGGEAPSAFSIAALTASRLPNGQPQVEATVTNTGGRALDMAGSLSLTNGPGGLSAGPFDARLGTTLAPGDTAAVAIPLDELLPNGPWDALISMNSGLLTGTAEATITFPDAGVAAPVATTPVDTGLPMWVTVAIVLALLLLLTIVVLLLRRRRPQGDDVPVDALLVPDRDPVGVLNR